MGTSISRATGTAYEKITRSMPKSEIDIAIRLVDQYAKKGQKKFDECLCKIETEIGEKLSAVDHADSWNAIRNFDKILKGFKGDDKELLIEMLYNERYQPTNRPKFKHEDKRKLCLCVGASMGWGTNAKAIRTNFIKCVSEPLASFVVCLDLTPSDPSSKNLQIVLSLATILSMTVLWYD